MGVGGSVFGRKPEGNRVFSPHHLDPFEVGRFWSPESSSSWILIAHICIYWCYLGEGNSIETAVSSRHFLRIFLRKIYWKSKWSRKIPKVQEFHSAHFLAGSQDFSPEKIPSLQPKLQFFIFRWIKNCDCRLQSNFLRHYFLLTPTSYWITTMTSRFVSCVWNLHFVAKLACDWSCKYERYWHSDFPCALAVIA